MIKSETFDSGTVSSSIAWNPTTKVMTETITLPSGKNIVETTLKGLPETLEYDGAKLLQYNYGTGNVLSSIRKNFDLHDNHAAELSYTYNNWRKVSRRTEEFTAQNAPTVADYEYTYSKGLHLIGKQENEENRRTAYQYDSYYRLRRVDYDCAYSSSDPTCATGRTNVFKCNQSETDCEDFQLDGVHNIRASRENQTDFSWTVDGFNRLTQKSWNNESVTYTYDSNNNLVSEDFDGSNPPEIVYTYDKLNRLTSVTNSDYFVEYSYDPFNRRTEKTVYYTENSDTFERTHKYAYDGWDIISEEIKTVRTSDTPNTVTSWQLRRYVDQGTDNHIIMDTVSCSDDGNGNCSPNESTLQRTWFHKDERGNVIAVSDGNGTIYERYRYRVYGEHEVLNADFTPKTTAALSPFLWGGSLYEPETNLYWMRNRYYHIDMHRFINQDPIGIWGDANNLGNGFAYVAGMVVEASDPSGLAIWIEENGPNDEVKLHLRISISNPEDKTGYTSWSFGTDVDNSADKFSAFYGSSIIGEVYVDEKKGGTVKKMLLTSPQQDKMARNTLQRLVGRKGIYSVINPEGITCRGFSEEMYYMFKYGSFDFNTASELFDKIAGNIPDEEPYHAGYDREIIDNGDGTSTERYYDENGILDTEAVRDNVTGEIISCFGSGCEFLTGDSSLYPYDPNSTMDPIQKILMSNILAKMLKRGESEQPSVFVDTGSGPNGAIMIYRNPYYVNKDPLKAIFFDGNDGTGKPMIYRNPFVPGAEYGYDATTYEKWQQKGFVQPEVDPWE